MIQLHSAAQPAHFQITSQPAVLELRSPRAKLSIETEAAKLEIRQPAGVLEIDGTASRASIGLKTPIQFARDIAALGENTVLETTGRIAQNGDRLARIQSGENAVVEIAAEGSVDKPLDITLAPLAPPEIHYTWREPEIVAIPGKTLIQAEPSPIQTQYTPGTVDIRMAQYASIRFWTTGGQIDTMG
ncbi:MAG: yviE [Firmicutes bacterium]|nr:yviE [Bacillota bacterium]